MPAPETAATIDAEIVLQWCTAALAALRRHQGVIDALNVYPVPDADTGTNLVLTWESATTEVARRRSYGPSAPTEVLGWMARGALLGAHGNSGVLLAEFLRALAEAPDAPPDHGVRPETAMSAAGFAAALSSAATACRQAVVEPIEGTALSILSAAAERAVETAEGGGALTDVCAAVVSGATAALARTPDQLSVLRSAGVVDAGGCGFTVVLDALAGVVDPGRDPFVPPAPTGPGVSASVPAEMAGCAHAEGGAGNDYEVLCLLAAHGDLADLRARLAGWGDSIVVTGGTPETDASDAPALWNVHVHVPSTAVSSVVDACLETGQVHRTTVTWLGGEVGERRGSLARTEEPSDDRTVLMIVSGDGLRRLAIEAGASVLTAPDPAALTVDEVTTAIHEAGTGEVVVLLTDPATRQAVETAVDQARTGGSRVAFVPAESSVQALAALAVYDPDRRLDQAATTMTEAVAATRWAGVEVAAAAGRTAAGDCQAGDLLVRVGGEVVGVAAGPLAVGLTGATTGVLERLLSEGGELVTIVTGAPVQAAVSVAIQDWMTLRWPLVELQLIEGGQVEPPLLLGVE